MRFQENIRWIHVFQQIKNENKSKNPTKNTEGKVIALIALTISQQHPTSRFHRISLSSSLFLQRLQLYILH